MKMKKVLSAILVVCIMMMLLAGCVSAGAAEGNAGGDTKSSFIPSLLMMVGILVVFYFFMIRPEKKRKQKAQEMRDSMQPGDRIVTIGGLVGKVVHVTDSTVTFETGEDRVRIEVTKGAISVNEGHGNKEKTDSEETLEN